MRGYWDQSVAGTAFTLQGVTERVREKEMAQRGKKHRYGNENKVVKDKWI